MPQAVLHRSVAECGPEQWPVTYELEGRFVDVSPFFTTMAIDGFIGDWLSTDPVDPPRIYGTFSGDLAGPFEAVHCAANDVFIDNCG
ncbi:hypothetical protein OV079_49315 [Nannocystis pusilla]|uniref:Uncharacterized protein n=1 Tax=Nannocystis pusilla TaxID=889268 RepID=A0A9X3F168_9BACT|nr:hypothetical protein [Nannocystis pusilla]MCY1013400.1 hypothetical protein [Nannocystis pusilla]